MLIASRRSHIPSSNYSTPPSLQTTTAQEATTAAATEKERTRELPQDTYHTQKRHKPKEQTSTHRKNNNTDRQRRTETERQQQSYPPLLQTLKAVVLGINYPRIVRGIVVVFCVALIQNSLAVVIAVGGGRDSVRVRILPHFVGWCSQKTSSSCYYDNVYCKQRVRTSDRSIQENCKCKGERRCSHSSAASRKELLIYVPSKIGGLGNPKVFFPMTARAATRKKGLLHTSSLCPPCFSNPGFVRLLRCFLPFSDKLCRLHKNGS
jgi:hypothetical protein